MALFLVDESLPSSLAAALRENGHSASHTSEVGLNGRPDAEVFGYAQLNRSCVVTSDLDFSNLNLFPLGSHSGIVILRLSGMKPSSVRNRFLEALADEVGDDLIGSLFIVGPGMTRIRRP